MKIKGKRRQMAVVLFSFLFLGGGCWGVGSSKSNASARGGERTIPVLSNVNMELIVVQRLKVGKKKREKKSREVENRDAECE